MLTLFPDFLVYQQIAPFLIRIVLGIIFLVSGYSKLKSFSHTSKFFNSLKIRPAKFWVGFVSITELILAVMLFFGIWVQLAAIIISLIMLVAIFKVKIKESFLASWALDLLILITALSLLFLGPGVFSFDLPL